LGPYGSVRGARGNSRPYRESERSTVRTTRMTYFGLPRGLRLICSPGLSGGRYAKHWPACRVSSESSSWSPAPAACGTSDACTQYQHHMSGRWARQTTHTLWPHSISVSARMSTELGIVRPSAFATGRLITDSSLVGNSPGRSLGGTPCRILSTK
jgi:hypothetical protein